MENTLIRREPFDPFLGTDETTESFPSGVNGAGQQKSDPYALHEGDRDALKEDFRSIVAFRCVLVIGRMETTTVT